MRGYSIAQNGGVFASRPTIPKQLPDHYTMENMTDGFPGEDLSDLNPHARPFWTDSNAPKGVENSGIKNDGKSSEFGKQRRDTEDKSSVNNGQQTYKNSVPKHLRQLHPGVNRRHTISTQDSSSRISQGKRNTDHGQITARSDNYARKYNLRGSTNAPKSQLAKSMSSSEAHARPNSSSGVSLWNQNKTRASRSNSRASPISRVRKGKGALALDDDTGKGEKGQQRKRRYSVDTLDFTELQNFDVPSFLKHIRLHKYTDTLAEHNVVFSKLIQMDEDALEQTGVHARGARLRLLKAIDRYNEFMAENWNCQAENEPLPATMSSPLMRNPPQSSNLSSYSDTNFEISNSAARVSQASEEKMSFRYPVKLQQNMASAHNAQQPVNFRLLQQDVIFRNPEHKVEHHSFVEPSHMRAIPDADNSMHSASVGHTSRMSSIFDRNDDRVFSANSTQAQNLNDIPNVDAQYRDVGDMGSAFNSRASGRPIMIPNHVSDNLRRPRATSAPPPRSSMFSWPQTLNSMDTMQYEASSNTSEVIIQAPLGLSGPPTSRIGDVMNSGGPRDYVPMGLGQQQQHTSGTGYSEVSDSNLKLDEGVLEQGMRLLNLLESNEDVSDKNNDSFEEVSSFFSSPFGGPNVGAQQDNRPDQGSYYGHGNESLYASPARMSNGTQPSQNAGRLVDDLTWVRRDAWAGPSLQSNHNQHAQLHANAHAHAHAHTNHVYPSHAMEQTFRQAQKVTGRHPSSTSPGSLVEPTLASMYVMR
ncbi:hypothetical protein SARC_03427 [Sphaeroforma arctica JP610]|uniref:SAM domain-containing protein n=1 Tax=Sphaeroforma arctica JP610 TaxID=667725 RepID=A0A0L0G5N7_9EUKA|nr:hypothetical protein SARC_03427 [Sphaeroforma arctica JP610]KNC84347.1 hypothetical protein SARC_03427 [Sphaeroforma arctica JP610]|eukprot:XP_014158249.1 hypothetical protein SARC_03427 [Sphaeroforma arctica JP610]